MFIKEMITKSRTLFCSKGLRACRYVITTLHILSCFEALSTRRQLFYFEMSW